ncbi:hypothetical protein BABINDRAFT_160664 [Babjeviella inositovora NRRL Y-12698]|uniref:Nucleolar complex-associated protein 3 n=1 Tax=Babjeviella inositovora NRRL Y-12698 TaxID=984486 RepID=A0A1E3QUD6_9ASCO|nr:uncharacterized protein BABINDRAFT_160664 [Babjeviella inositovora NRRL Y-12698]ODQ81303.1 hypothetical protein BABINDRAFT_160664 [Babjeviella inositovora NRRL Y-12698]
MAKRGGKQGEDRRKKQRQDADALLSTGVFGNSEKEKYVNSEDEEQDYELKPRRMQNLEETVEGLPTKGADGKVTRVMRAKVVRKEQPKAEEKPVEAVEEAAMPEVVSESEEEEEDDLTPQERLVKLKEEIAHLVSGLIEEPEENIRNLNRLRKMAESKNPLTQRLSLLSMVPAFKAIAPSYRIRALTDAEKREKVGRDVARARHFEEHLVANYKNYIDLLTRLAKVSVHTPNATEHEIISGRIATSAACELASALRFFNFRAELLVIIIRRLNKRPADGADLKVFLKCITTLEELLTGDADSGDVSFDVVRILQKALRDKKFRVDESVVNLFLSLNILTDYDPFVQDDKPNRKVNKKDRVHLSKTQRKARKENIAIEEEMRQAEHAVSAVEREKFQAQILKMLLTTYLEILRSKPQELMAAVLEGLAKHAHMTNFELLGDFMEVLREIVRDLLVEEELTSGEIRQVLLAIVTAFSLLGSNLQYKQLKVSIDLSAFINALYTITPQIAMDADLEFSHKSLRLADPLALANEPFKPAVNVSTKVELWLKAMNHIFFLSRNGTAPRAAAFTKKIYMALLQTPEKSSIALLKFIDKLMTRHSTIASLYSTEDRVSTVQSFSLQGTDLMRANGEMAMLWENNLLEKHYSTVVVKGLKNMQSKAKEENKQ